MYYKFDGTGTNVANQALNPPAGTANATILGGITQGGNGQCGGALIGSGISSTTDYLNTNWNTAFGTSSWTIAFWSSGISTNSTLYYVFGDNTAGSFRCFTNGVAGSQNWILRGTGITDVTILGGALATPTHNAFVYDSIAGNIKGYLNGVLVATITQTAPLNINGTAPFKVMGYGTNIGAPAGGLMDEFRAYKYALTAAQIAQIASFPTAAPVAQAQTFCGNATVANLTATGINLQWYANATGGSALDSSVVLTTGNYYVSQTVGVCESSRTQVNVTILSTPNAPVAAAQSFCGNARIADLIAIGTNLAWYDTALGGLALDSTVVLTSGNYYVSQSNDICESDRTLVNVTIHPIPSAPSASNQEFCGSAIVADLIAVGNNLQWYTTMSTDTVLANNEPLQSGNYFVSQTENGCESDRTQISVTLKTIPPSPTGNSNQTIPNTTPTLADLIVVGQNVTWYASLINAQSGSNPLPLSTALVNGSSYFATQTIDGCRSQDALSVTVSLTASTNQITNSNIKVFPNPTKGNLQIESDEWVDSIQIFNLFGQTLIFEKVNNTNISIDIAHFQKGVYLAKLSISGKTKELKLIKE
jgi:hypothetical protein